jgi:hypothetical protein
MNTTNFGLSFNGQRGDKMYASTIKLLCAATATLALVGSAHAATRTFVSNTGNDANVSSSGCSETAPCATFATALSVTKSGGEIVALTGGSYGPLNITTPLTVIGAPGASITGSAGTTAITIAVTGTVFIRGIDIDGANNGTNIGIQLTSGNLVLRDSKLELLNLGLTVGNNSSTAHADVINCDFVGNTTAIQTDGTGVPFNTNSDIFSGSGQTLVRINAGNFIDNTTVFNANNPGSSGGSPNVVSATFWSFQPTTGMPMNVTGSTTFMTVTGTGSGATNEGVQSYTINSGGSGAPN